MTKEPEKEQETKYLGDAFEKFLNVVADQKGPLFAQANRAVLEEAFFAGGMVVFALLNAWSQAPQMLADVALTTLREEIDNFGGNYDKEHFKKLDS